MTRNRSKSKTCRHLEVLRTDLTSEGDRETGQVELRVPEELWYFKGHFDGDPVLPGVVQLDSAVLAQVERIWPDLGRLEGVRQLKFSRVIRPGEVIRVTLERKKGAARVVCRISANQDLCTSGILSFSTVGYT